MSGRNFSWALEQIKEGKKVRREAWGEGIFVFMVPGSTFEVSRHPLLGIFEAGHRIIYEPHIDVCDGESSVAATSFENEDLFADDWELAD